MTMSHADYALMRERDEDVFDSLSKLGPSSIKALAEDTGRDPRSIACALSRLRENWRVDVAGTYDRGRHRRAQIWAVICPHCRRPL